MSNAAKILYKDLFYIIRNAHIIDIKINSLFIDTSIEYQNRSKKDNTTRLYLGYGYDNNDYYSIRLDFSHKGVDCTHLNFKSPKGITTPCFTSEEFNYITNKIHDKRIDKYFIEYESRFYLKEEHGEIQSLVDSILKKYTHKKILNNVDENTVLDLLNVLEKMMSFFSANIEYDDKFDKSMLLFDRTTGFYYMEL